MVPHPDSPVREDDATGPATDVDADPPYRRRQRHDCSGEKNQSPSHTDIDGRGKRLESTQGPPGGLQLAKRRQGPRVPTCAPPTSRRLLARAACATYAFSTVEKAAAGLRRRAPPSTCAPRSPRATATRRRRHSQQEKGKGRSA